MAPIDIITSILILLGAGMMFLSVLGTRQVLQMVVENSTSRSWRILSLLMIFFIVGYLTAIVFLWTGLKNLLTMITGAVFFFGALFVYMVVRVGRSTIHDLQNQTQTLETQREKLQAAYDEETRLRQDLIASQHAALEFSTPVIPISEGILAMPLIGSIDPDRAQRITKILLQEVSRNRAQVAIIDITGVPVLDATIAQALLKATRGVQLLGATPLLTGLDAKAAQEIATSGLDFSGLVVQPTLAEGLVYAMQFDEKD